MEQLRWKSDQIEQYHSLTTSTIVLKKNSEFCLQKIQFLSSDLDPQLDPIIFEKLNNRTGEPLTPQYESDKETKFDSNAQVQGGSKYDKHSSIAFNQEEREQLARDLESSSQKNVSFKIPKGYFSIFDNKFLVSKKRLKETLLFMKKDTYSIQDFFNYHIHLNLKDYNPEIMDSYFKNTHFIGKMNPIQGDIEEVLVRSNDTYQELLICFKWKTDQEINEIEKESINNVNQNLIEETLPTNIEDIAIQIDQTQEVVEHKTSLESQTTSRQTEILETSTGASRTTESIESIESIKSTDPTEESKNENTITSNAHENIVSTSSVPNGSIPDSLSDYYSLMFFVEKDMSSMSHVELRSALSLYKNALKAKDAIIEREESQIERLTNEVVAISFKITELQNEQDEYKRLEIERERNFRTLLDAKDLELERLRAEFDVMKETGCCSGCSLM